MVTRASEERQQQFVTGEQRESIWSVSKGVKHVYFALFILQFSAGTIWTIARGVESVAALWQVLAPLAITAAAVSLVVTEVGRYLMVLARSLEEKLERTRERHRAQGRAQALALLDEDTRKDVERKLRRNADSETQD